jgi:alpha-D-ribose 1-methylphosphonate 5-phosphate C-P lyase
MTTEKTSTTNASQYSKTEEYKVGSYEEASVLADSLFQAFIPENTHVSGSRTTEEAKVRVRRTRAKNTQSDNFRVIVYRRNTPEKKPLKEANERSTNTGSAENQQTKAQRKKAAKEANRAKSARKKRPYGATKSS